MAYRVETETEFAAGDGVLTFYQLQKVTYLKLKERGDILKQEQAENSFFTGTFSYNY